jgi:hypothetical protein
MNELSVGVSSPSPPSLSPRFKTCLHSWTTSTIHPPRDTTPQRKQIQDYIDFFIKMHCEHLGSHNAFLYKIYVILDVFNEGLKMTQ